MNYIRPSLCVLLILAVGCRPPAKPVSKEAGEPAGVPVTVAPRAARSVQHVVEVMGTLWAFEEVPLIPKTEGRVQTVAVDVGDRVRPGQLLGTFDPTDFELNVKQAERSLQVELAKLGLD